MEKKNYFMMKMLGAGLSLSLLWGASPLMADSGFQTENRKKTNLQRPVNTQRFLQYGTKSHTTPTAQGNALKINPSKAISNAATKNPLISNPGVVNKSRQFNLDKRAKFNSSTPAGKTDVINLRRDIGLKSVSAPPNVDSLTNFGGVAAPKKEAATQTGFGGWGGGYGKAPSDPNFGGYGGNNGSGVVPPGPDRVPGSTPPPQAQSNQPPITTNGGLFPLPNLPQGSTPPASASGNPSGDPLFKCIASGGGLNCFH